jgi:hypothetical protein
MPSKDFVAFDPLALLSELRDVDYLVVGGFAAVLYGAPTVTGDLDIMPSPHEQNVARLATVLARLHAVVREPRSSSRRLAVTVDLLRQTAQSAPLGGQLRTRTDAGPLDILWHLHDGRGYRDLVTQSCVLAEEELHVRVIALDDLIDIKVAINRPQDRAAVPYLRKIRQRTQS